MSKLKFGNSNNGEKRFDQRRFRYGAFATLITIGVLVVVILLNYLLGAAEDNWALSIDLSPTRVTSFDDATYETLRAVDEDIIIHLLFQDATETELKVQLEEMAKKYHAINSRISYDYIDPYQQPAKLATYVDTATTSLPEGSVIVTRADDSKFRCVAKSNLYKVTYYEDKSSQYGFSYGQAFNGEAQLTSAVKFVDSDDTPNVYFLSGHNEIALSYCSTISNYLQQENYNVAELVLSDASHLVAGDTVIITCPQVDLTDAEYEILSTWLQAGGRMLFTLDNSNNVKMDDIPNFKALLAIYQLSYGDGYVVEDTNATSNWINNPVMVLPQVNAESDVTKKIAENKLRLIVYGGRPINPCDIPLSGVVYDVLLSSSDRSSVYSDMSGSPTAIDSGSQILAYSASRQPDVYDRTKDTRIVLLSSPYLYVDTSILTSSYNLDFSMDVVEWLVNRDVSVYVRSNAIIDTTLNIPDAATAVTIGVVVCGAIPLLFAAAGIVIWIKRRRL